MIKSDKIKILLLCTGNSCRSQMAEGFLRQMKPGWHIRSAGTHPEKAVNPLAVEVMAESGIDISAHKPDHVERYVNESWDLVLTVCDNAKESCPVFPGPVKVRKHIPFDDPADAKGSREEQSKVYRRVRDEIKVEMVKLAENQ